MATPSSILAWRIPRTEEPGRLQSMGYKESDTTATKHSLAVLDIAIFIFAVVLLYLVFINPLVLL